MTASARTGEAVASDMPGDAGPGWLRITTQSPKTLASAYSAVAVRSSDQMAPGPCVVTAELGWCGGSAMFRESHTASTQSWMRFHAPSYACVVPAEPFPGGRYFGHPIHETSVLTLEPDQDFWLVAPAGADYAGFALTRGVALRHAAALQIAGEEHLREVPRVIELPLHRVQALRRFVLTVLASLQQHRELARSPLAWAHVEESAAVLLICAFLGRSRIRGAGRPKASYERIARQAREFVVSRPQAPPTLVELCEHLHVGVRALNYAFQSALGTSAGEYLRTVRLNRVREDLLAARGGARVLLSQTASKWGFWHASQFTRQYRALFGERPSETLRPEQPSRSTDAPLSGKAPGRVRIRTPSP